MILTSWGPCGPLVGAQGPSRGPVPGLLLIPTCLRAQLRLRRRRRRQHRAARPRPHLDVGQREQHREGAGVLGDAAVAALRVAERALDDEEGVLDLRPHAGLAALYVVLEGEAFHPLDARGLLGHDPADAGYRVVARDLRPLGDAGVVGVRVADLVVFPDQRVRHGDVTRVGGREGDGVHTGRAAPSP